MKKRILFGMMLIGSMLILQTSCDKVENPIKPPVEQDTTIFPGNWADYPEPVWTQNANSNRNILLEDYTGHRCPNCPQAADEAKLLEDNNPGRVFVASVHAGLGGISSFQETATDCGLPSNPENKYCTQFYNDISLAYGNAFSSGFGFIGNPMGTINRTTPTGPTSMFLLRNAWAGRVSDVLNANDLKVNIQAQSNYYASTNGFYLHTEVEFLEDLTGNYNTVVYLIENDILDWQDVNSYDSLYHHHNVMQDCIDGLPWGRTISGGTETGNKTYFDYSYKLPSGKTNEDYHLLIYVYDLDTYEVLQVIKHEF